MPTLLSDVPSQLQKWTVGPPRQKNGQMSICSATGPDGAWPTLQLLPRERLGDIVVPFEPSVFRGTGAEPRKNILFTIPEDVMRDLQAIEEWAQKNVPSLSAPWHSCLKEPGNYGAGLKAKINVEGRHVCLIFDAKGAPTEWPESWHRLPVIPIIEVKGVYSQKTGSGLILDVIQLMVGEELEPKSCEWF